VKGILVRREKYSSARAALLSKDIEFFEESNGYYTLFLFPVAGTEVDVGGKPCYLIDGDTSEVEFEGKTFKIEGKREVIDEFAPKFERRNLKVDLEKPDVILEIRRWNGRYLVSVSSVFH
jgi:hypothetical protein